MDELLERTSLPDLVGRRVRLVLAFNGRVWKAGCPFHDDDGTSFYVHADGYHCFGCGAHGNAIDFVMRTATLGFDDVVAQLSAAAGLSSGDGGPRRSTATGDRRRR